MKLSSSMSTLGLQSALRCHVRRAMCCRRLGCPLPVFSSVLASSSAPVALFVSSHRFLSTRCCASFYDVPPSSTAISNTTAMVSVRSNSSVSAPPPEANSGVGSRLGMDGFTDVRYNTAADYFLERLECVIDELNHEEIEEVNSSGGVLTIETSKHGTFVLNKQAPKLQLWLSSPISGPHHYDMMIDENAPDSSAEDDNVSSIQWLSDHDQHDLKEKLQNELSQALGVQVKL